MKKRSFERRMNHIWMRRTAGMLILIGGIIEFLVAFLAGGVSLYMFIRSGWVYSWNVAFYADVLLPFVPLLAPAIFGIIGGIYAIQKRRWLFSLISSFLSFIPFGIVMAVVTDWQHPDIGYVLPTALPFLLGIISPVLIYLSKDQFTVSSSAEG